MGDPASGAKVVNIANGLTLLRLLLVPVFVVLMLANGGHSTGWRICAFVAFALACVTDLVDGELARRHNLVTEVGKIADPIADKALIGSALLVPVGTRRSAVVGDRRHPGPRARHHRASVLRDPPRRDPGESRRQGSRRWCRTSRSGCYVLPLTGWLATARWWVMALALVLTVATGADYVSKAVTLRRTSARSAWKQLQSRMTATWPRRCTDCCSPAARRSRRRSRSPPGWSVRALTTTPGSSSTYRGGRDRLRDRPQGVACRCFVGVARRTWRRRSRTSRPRWPLGVRERLGATWGLGLTGVAGPDPQDGKAVGTLFVGLAGPAGAVAGDVRGARRVTATRSDRRAVEVALTVLRDRLADPE